jgi:hypothetical protein
MRIFEARIGDAEAVDPVHLGEEAHHLAEGMGDAEKEDQADEPIEPRIVHEGGANGGEEHGHEHGHDEDEHHHADQIDSRLVDRDLLRMFRHGRDQHASTLSQSH